MANSFNQKLTLRQSIVILVVFFLLIGLSAWLFLFLLEENKNERLQEFSREFLSDAESVTLRSEDFVKEYSELLLALRALFRASESVTEEEWGLFVNSFRPEIQYPAVKYLQYAEVEDDNYIIKYSEPLAGKPYKGYDYKNIPEVITSMELARDTNNIGVTNVVAYLDEEKSVIAQLPIYKNNTSIEKLDERRESFIGTVIVVIDTNKIFTDLVLSGSLGTIHSFEVVDVTEDPSILYSIDESKKVLQDYSDQPYYSQTTRVTYGGRIWQLRFNSHAPPNLEQLDLFQPIIAFGLGVGVALLISLLLYGSFQLQLRAQELAEQLTEELNKFKLAADSAFDMIVITDKEGIVLYTNKAIKNITGFSREEALGKKAGKLWGGLMKKSYYKKMWQTISIEKKTFIGELKNKRKNGDEYYASLTVSPVLDDNNNVRFFVAIERDITKEKQIDKVKTEFVSLAAHQLRTPLTSIKWYAELFLKGDLGRMTKKQKESMEEMYEINKRLMGLVNGLLNVSRLDLGTFAVEPELVHPKDVINTHFKELMVLAKDKEINFKKKIGKDLPKMKLDPSLFGIIIHNLLSNAIKYTPEHGDVLLTADKIKNKLQIKVIDNGYGIPNSQKYQIFTKLFRAENVLDKNIEGTGLGLYIVKAILDQIGGNITFESQQDAGTTFIVDIPLKGMKARKGSRKITVEG